MKNTLTLIQQKELKEKKKIVVPAGTFSEKDRKRWENLKTGGRLFPVHEDPKKIIEYFPAE